MRMHTIPQNVTAYEDKIVGMLIGRQFVYLAIAGVTIFVLMTAQIGPLLIRLFLSILIAALAAALALYKPDDRNFDALFMSYIYAMFGPTEWTWQKDVLPMSALKAITADFHVASRKEPTQQGTPQSRNLQRVSRYQSFISQKEDPSEVDEDMMFIEHLNFSEPIPDRAIAAVDSNKPAPPMLTKKNYAQAKSTPTPKPTPVSFPQPTPISPIAGSSQAGITFSYNGKQQSISKRSNQRTNRSLSRPLLSNGVLPLPIRGEMKVEISTDLENALTAVQPTSPTPTQPAVDLAGQAKADPVATPSTPATPSTNTPATPEISSETPNAVDISHFYDEDGKLSTIRQQINTLGQSMSYSGITTTKDSPMSDTTLSNNNPDEPMDESTPPTTSPNSQEDPVTIVKQPAMGPGNATADVEEQLRQAEHEIQKQISSEDSSVESPSPYGTSPSSPPDLNTANQTNLTSPAASEDQNTVLLDQYKSEIERLIAYNKEVETRARQAEEALAQMRQTTPEQGQVAEQQNLVAKLRTEQQQTAAYAQELQQKLSGENGALEHSHNEYAPVPGISPVVPEATDQTPPASTAPTLEPATTDINQPQDLQARMSAAGVAPAETASSAPPSQANTNSQSTSIALTNEPNIINGRVVDAQGQSLSGVIVVVKNAQGESKRALKTNKLGQFVITTPLANGSYTVEVDKKGLSFDIINVELNGSVSPPVLISAK